MLSLVLVFLLLWVALMVFLGAGTLWFQDYIYSQPVSGVAWRAPAAGTAMTAFFLLWAFADSRDPPGRFRALFDFSDREEQERFKELWVPREGRRVRYELKRDTAGHYEYLDDNRRPLPGHADPIIVKENGEEVEFKADRDAQGNFKFSKGQGQELRYTDARGREMWESRMGEISTFRWGLLLGNLALNFFHLAAWFLVLWLLLEFQWAHALGLAAVLWVVMTLLIVPPLLSRVEAAARQSRSAPTEGARLLPVSGWSRLSVERNGGRWSSC